MNRDCERSGFNELAARMCRRCMGSVRSELANQIGMERIEKRHRATADYILAKMGNAARSRGLHRIQPYVVRLPL